MPPPGVTLIDAGTGGIAIVQELLDGYEALIVIDAVRRGGEPGTLYLLEPEIDNLDKWTDAERQAFLATVGVVGFCMGGALSLLATCASDRFGAAVVFYRRNPNPIERVRSLHCPLLGLYGEADQSIPPSEVERLRRARKAAGK